jgi:hypothetical protein
LEWLFYFAQTRERVEIRRHKGAKTRNFFKRKVAKKEKCIQPFELHKPHKPRFKIKKPPQNFEAV